MQKSPEREQGKNLTSTDTVENVIKAGLDNYLAKISPLGLVGKVYLIEPSEENPELEPTTYLVNLFKEEVSFARGDFRYSSLTRAGGQLERRLADVLHLRVRYLNPSRREEFERKYEEQGVSLDILSVDDPLASADRKLV